MNKLFLICLLAVAGSLNGFAASWIDVTDYYVKNPRYDENRYTDWQGTQLSGYNPMENAEHYQKTYNTYQKLTGLPQGRYRVSLNAFYRMGSAQDDYTKYSSGNYSSSQHALLYATSSVGSYTQKIVPVSSGARTNSLGGNTSWVSGDNGWFLVPDNMVAAYWWFENGYYKNSVECQVGSNGELTIGIRKSNTLEYDWTCIDNWKLEYYGDPINITSVEITGAPSEMVAGDQVQLSTNIQPANATDRTIKWSSSNPSVATVNQDGYVTAVSGGTVTITAASAASAAIKATATIFVNACVAPSASNVIINELMASNVDVYRDPSTNFGSWVELYNPSNEYVKLGGMYVTDDPDNMKKHQLVNNYGTISPHGFGILNFDHFEVFAMASYKQIDDKLSPDGGSIYLTNGTEIITQMTYPAGISRVSYARTIDGGEEWSYTGNPTPGTSNQQGGGFAVDRLAAPEIDTNAGLFTGTKTFNVTIPEGATLRYTTDGSAPTLTNGQVSETGQFVTDQSVSYRFRLFQEGFLPSPVVTRTFILNNANEPFPIISIAGDPTTFGNGWNAKYDSDFGIFQYSENGRPGNGQQTKYNANMEWERPVNFEYITTDNECVLSQECDFQACGGWSRAFSPHSFKLKAGKPYEGLNSFDYQFFKEKPYLKHKTLQIRNGGNDTGCRIKDAAVTQIVGRSGLYIEYQSWQPVHVYVNGEPYAVLNMREPNNKHYGQTNYGIDTDLMDQFEICPDSGYVQKEGTKESFMRLVELSETASDAGSYNEICKLLDIDEYVNYMATELYIGNTDWPQNNVKGFRDVVDGKFRFVLFDTDHAFGTTTPLTTFFNKQVYTFDPRYGYDYSTNTNITGTRLTKENPFVTLFINMIKSATFRKKFIDAFCIVAGSVYTPERVNAIVDEMVAYGLQGGYFDPRTTGNDVKNKFANRQNTLIDHLKNTSQMELSGVNAQNVTLSSNVNGAGILINGMDVPTGEFNGKLFAPITLKAQAPAGYEFLGWKSPYSNASKTSTVFTEGSSWKYYQESLDGIDWKSDSYSDAGWSNGTAPIGYAGSGSDIAKVLKTTTSQKNKPTYYFRKSFNISDLMEDDVFTLNYKLDDGCVVYVNGKEAGRDNMPAGETDYNTLATSYAYNNPNTGSMILDASLFKKGTNVIAVEVHNNSTTSTDIMWEAELLHQTASDNANDYVSTDIEYTLPKTGAVNLTAVWKRIDVDQMLDKAAAPIKINEVCAEGSSYVNEHIKKDDWVELYNTTDMDLDCAGMYLTDNLSKPTKYQIKNTNGVNTIIPAHGRILIWCGKRDQLSQLQCSFKLDNKDGCVLVLSSDPTKFAKNNPAFAKAYPQMVEFTDTMYYNTLRYDQTVGRYPDGGNEYYVMNRATINKPNTMTQSDVFVKKDVFFFLMPGDANVDGNVDMKDARLVTDYFIGKVNEKGLNMRNADANRDGNVNMSDANTIVNMITE